MLEGIPISIKECLRVEGLDSTIGLSSRVFSPSEVTQAAVLVCRFHSRRSGPIRRPLPFLTSAHVYLTSI
jgi:hypothetical protein